MLRTRWLPAWALLLLLTGSCDLGPTWEMVHQDLDSALLSVWGTAPDDVWAVGADAGDGPLVLHYDGTGWDRLETGQRGALWWVFGFEGGPVYMGGEGGTILRYDGGAFHPMTTPGTNTVFGIWGASPDDVWAVGGASDATGGFAWRLDGDRWVEEPTVPSDVPERAAIWKVFGRGTDDAWLVGSNGVSLRWDGAALSEADTGVGSSLFTVHADAERYVAVGGLASGIIVENDGEGWHTASADPALPGLSGVHVQGGERAVAVGFYGSVLTRDADGWHDEDHGFYIEQSFHAVWVDPEGGIWAVGGQTLSPPLDQGMLLHWGEPLRGGIR